MSEAINMHKRIAMGEKLTGQKLKHGGMPEKAPKPAQPPKMSPMKRKGAMRGG
jgi:hypothetical protein